MTATEPACKELLELLGEFLAYPLDDGTEILDRFADLPSAIRGQGNHPMERFVYVPGERQDRILLIAHVDTVWDRQYTNPQSGAEPIFLEDRAVSGTETAGLGADDRAGCALLWHFRHSGHSLLLLDGEEKGHFAAKYLVSNHGALLRELNGHRYIMALDLPGGRIAHYHGIHNSRDFDHYVRNTLQCEPITKKVGSDLNYLCRGACGVNLGVGYHSFHTPMEFLALHQWLDTVALLQQVLASEQRAFRTRKLPRLRDYIIKRLKSLWGFVRKKLLRK